MQKLSFSYGAKYLGPSLSPSYQEGATYNRFNSGQDFKGDNTDPTGSTQVYHSLTFGLQAWKNVKLSFTSTFQEELNNEIKYETYNSDGSVYATNNRKIGTSYNNQRLNATVTNIYSNSSLFVMSNFYYEMPTTQFAKDTDMLYGVGMQPLIGIFSNTMGLYHGVKFSFERDYYQRQEFRYQCESYTCHTKRQTSRISTGAYIGYNVSDKLGWDGEVTFDWDQDGDQVETNEFSKNMDDVLEIGPRYQLTPQINLATKLQMAISDPSIDKSAVLATFLLSL
ncbi:MAG: hypothetical protein HON90_01470 [Halobacteriovoraceae bacterium]|nr:hypothetical protein [Halobacteriovoraceae bacterium]